MIKKVPHVLIVCALFLAFALQQVQASAVSSATPSPTSANQSAQYTVVFTTGNGNTNLIPGTSTITITFNDSTFVPATIDAANVTVNGTGASTVVVSGQSVIITTPVAVAKNGGQGTVVIAAAAGIRNPGVVTTYRIRLQTSAEPTDVYSPLYSITASTTRITSLAVTPNPSVESTAAAQTVTFNTGAGGYLTGNSSTITIKFPSGTTVPSGSISGVSVNGGSATATGADTTVTVTVPSDVGNSSGVTVTFTSGSGIVNPAYGGTGIKKAFAKTSSEAVYDTATYSVSAASALSVSAVTLGSNIANAVTSYTIDFVVSSPGGALTANTDTLSVYYGGTEIIPTSISTGNVTVSSGGFSDNPPYVSVSGSQVRVVTPVAVAAGGTVSLIFGAGANIQNPSAAGNYTITLRTSKDAAVASNAYTITAATSTVTQSTVALSNTTAATGSNYTFNFSVGAYGRMRSTIDSFMVTFPAGTGYASLGTTGSVNGVSATQRRVGATNVVSILVPASVTVSNSTAITLVVDTVTNPGNGTYSASIKTSVEASDVTTQSFVIGGTAATLSSVVPATPGVNQTSAYTFNVTGITNLAGNANDYVRVTFPEGTTLPATIANGNVTFAGGTGQTVSSVSVNTSARQVDVYVGANNKTFTSLTFSAAAAISNPSVPSTTYYKGTLLTSQQTQPATSPAYTISKNNTSVTAGTATATPNVINQINAAYQIVFTPTANGKLVGGTSAGSDSVWVQFLSGGTIVPASITASTVSMNGTSCTGVTIIQSGANGTVRVAVPSGLTLAASTQHTITFSTASGLQNGSSAGNYTVRVKTSADSAYSTQTSNLAIASAAALTVTQSTIAPSTVNAAAARTIKFTTGSLSSDTLAIGDTIRVVFPSNTSVPSSVSNSLITVNGVSIPSNATGSGQTLRFRSPVIVPALTNVTVAISSTANILNPMLVSTSLVDSVKTRQAGSSTVVGPVASPQYSTSATTTSVSTPTVVLGTYVPSTAGRDSVTFTTGSNGRLLAGTSTITITFPSGTTVPATPTTRVNGVSASASGSGTVLTITVPGSVSISNNGSVAIGVDGITNPVAGNYTLSVKTSVETNAVSSSSYAISNVAAVSALTVSLLSSPNPTDTVNMAGRYFVQFTVDATQGALTSGSGTITVTFPSNTAVPASITDSVQVNGTNATSVTSNSGTRQVVITTPVGIANGATVRVVFGTSTSIVNPSISTTYALQVKTSSQPTPATSTNYTIQATSTTLTNVVISVTPSEPSQLGRYTFTFNTGLRGKMVSGTSKIYLLFPFDATFTTGLPSTSTVTVNGVAADALQLSETALQEDTLIVTVPTSVTIGNQTAITVIVDSTSGLQNASTTSQLSYKIFTSVETGIATGDYTLPVQLSEFEAFQNGSTVRVRWTTESEINNAYWIVEKAVVPDEEDASLARLSFARIEAIEGQGTKSGATQYFMEDDEVKSGVTYAYRLLDVSQDGTITPHELKRVTVEVPNQFALFQNYPNPFNPSTTIRFNLPIAAKVSIKVYNLLGQEVADVVDRSLDAGFHKEVWNGLNTRGQRVASGLYIYRMTAVEINGGRRFQQTKKMLLLK